MLRDGSKQACRSRILKIRAWERDGRRCWRRDGRCWWRDAGLAVASLAIPGIGPLIAFGMVGAALLGIVGAAAGSAVGDQVEEELGEGIPHEDVYLYEDALRHGHSIVLAYVEEGDQADRAEEALNNCRRRRSRHTARKLVAGVERRRKVALRYEIRSRRGELPSWLPGCVASEAKRKDIYGC